MAYRGEDMIGMSKEEQWKQDHDMMNEYRQRAEKAEAEVERLTCKSKSCQWTQDTEGNWATECDEMFTFFDGGPADNRMNYCPYCGCVLEEGEV